MFLLFEDPTAIENSSSEERMFLRLVDRFLRKTESFYRGESSQLGVDAVKSLQLILPELYLSYSDWHDLERGTSVFLALRSSIESHQAQTREDRSPFSKKRREQALRAFDLLDQGIFSIFLQCYPDSPIAHGQAILPSGS